MACTWRDRATAKRDLGTRHGERALRRLERLYISPLSRGVELELERERT